MNDEPKHRAVFHLSDLPALRWLILCLGLVFAGICVVGRGSDEIMLLAAAMIAVILGAGALAIYLLRRRRPRGKQ